MSIVRVSVKFRGLCKALRARIRGRTEVALAREDRATTEAVVRHLPAGGCWIDRSDSDGTRVRMITKPGADGAAIHPELERRVIARQLERGWSNPN